MPLDEAPKSSNGGKKLRILSKVVEHQEGEDLITLPSQESEAMFEFDDDFEDKDKDEYAGLDDDNVDDEITKLHN